MLDAGSLNRRVTIEAEQRVANGQGGWITSWEPVATVWAEMIPLRGDEALQANIVRSVQLWKVTIRHRPSVTTAHRLRYRDLTLNIRSAADPDGLRERTVMTAESGVAA